MCVTARAPRSKAAFACAAVASLCPSETTTPRSSSRSISSPAPGSSGRQRHQPHRARVEQALEERQIGIAPGRGLVRPEPGRREERALEVHAEDPRARLVGRHFAHRCEHLLLGARDQRRQVRGDAALEQRRAGAPVPVGVRVEEVDAAEAVHLEVDEARAPRARVPQPPAMPTRAMRPSTTSTSPGSSRPSTSAASTPSLIAPVYEWSHPLVNTSCRLFARTALCAPALVYTISNPMAEIRLAGVTKMFGGVTAVDDVSLRDRRRRVPRPRRPVGLRQVDAAAHDRRARGGERRRDLHRRARRHRPRPAQPRRRDGLPDLRALPAHVRAPEHGLRAEGAAHAEGRDRQARRRGGRAARPLAAARPAPGAALRRPAAARRDGARDRPAAAGVPARRAPLEPRREAARRHARVARAAAPAARRHDRLRDARPDRGDDARAARRRDARRPLPPGRHAEAALRAPDEPVHRCVHRLAGDESRRRHGRRRRCALRAVPPARSPTAGRPAGVGEHVVLGIRPEAFEDAAFAPGPADDPGPHRGARGARLRRPPLLPCRRSPDQR